MFARCSRFHVHSRTPAATVKLAGVVSGVAVSSHLHHWMRQLPSFTLHASAIDFVTGARNPRCFAASGLAGVMSPVGLTHFNPGWTPPESMTCGAGP